MAEADGGRGSTMPGMYGIGDRERAGSGIRRERERFVADKLSEISLVAPWTVEEFRRWAETHLDLVIEVRPYARPQSPHLAGQCGLLAIDNGAAVIWVDTSRSERHQRQQVFHEFAHLLCKHHERRPLLAAMRSGDHPLVAGLPAEFLERALPPVPEAVPTSTRVEAEAELLGTKLAVQCLPLDWTGARPKNDMRVLSLWRQ